MLLVQCSLRLRRLLRLVSFDGGVNDVEVWSPGLTVATLQLTYRQLTQQKLISIILNIKHHFEVN